MSFPSVPEELHDALFLNGNWESMGALKGWLPAIIWECLTELPPAKRRNLARKLIIGREGLPWKEMPTSSSGLSATGPVE